MDDPLDLPNLIVALDPARSAIAIDGGVSQISDLGAAGRHYSQPDPNRRPALDPAGIKGGPALVADGSEVLYRTEAVVWGGSNAPRAIYCLVQGSAQVDRQILAEASTQTNNPIWEFGTDPSNTDRLRVYIRDDANTVRVEARTNAPVFAGLPRTVCVTWDEQGQGQIWVDGALDTTFTLAATLTLNRSSILGIMRSNPSAMFTGRLGPLYAYGEARTPAQAEVVEGYLASYPNSSGEPPPGVEVELYRWHDFEVEASPAGSVWDVEGEITWTLQGSSPPATRTSYVWWNPATSRFVYRFGAAFQGTWTGVTSSPVAALNGHQLAVTVTPSSNPSRTGWSGVIPGHPGVWARQKGPDGLLHSRTPVLSMIGKPSQWWNNLGQLDDALVEFIDQTGFSGVHFPTVGNGHFDVTSTGSITTSSNAVPDHRLFQALEALCQRCSDRGIWAHWWMWGKNSDGEFINRLSGGGQGTVSTRLHRYFAKRMAPVPGWWLGYGWDVEFWNNMANPTHFLWWMDTIGSFFGGYHHYLSARYSDSDAGQGSDPEPANRGVMSSRGTGFSTRRPAALQAADWEHWRTETNDAAIDGFSSTFPDRVRASTDRFRRRNNAWPQKDYTADSQIVSEIPRWLTRRVAAIHGRYVNVTDLALTGDPWPNKAAILSAMQAYDDDGAVVEEGGAAPPPPPPSGMLLGVHDLNGNPQQVWDFMRWLDGQPPQTFASWANHADDSGTCAVWQDVIRKEAGWPGIEMDSPWDRQVIRTLRDFVLAKPGRVANWSMAIMPDSEWNNSDRFAQAASGAFDQHFTALGNQLAGQGLADPAIPVIFRPGYEWDANWFPWGVAFNTTRAEQFAEFWRRIVTAMRGAQPNAQWYFDWNPNHDAFGWAQFILEPAWPGGAYVDYIGIDIYDHFDIACTNFQARWNAALVQLNNARDYALSKGKKLSLPEWGIWNVNCNSNEWGAGTDNPFWMERMHEWLTANVEHIHYHIYFNELSRHRLHAGQNPLAAAKFRELFGPQGQ